MLPLISLLSSAAAVQSVGISLWQHRLAMRFPLHGDDPFTAALSHPFPGITLLKPLKGADGETQKNLESWLTQDYPGPVQILFGVASEQDPVVEIVEGLLKQHPTLNARLIVCPPNGAANPKVSTLLQLFPKAAHDVLVISDADVRVPNRLLREIQQGLTQPGVGLVHCLYRIANPTTLPLKLEALAVNADFWAQVVQAQSLGMLDFALGAVMGISRPVLQEIGGFARIANFLADDFQLGNAVAKTGRRNALTSVVVECFGKPSGWKETWLHQLRWTRTVRICKPMPFFLSLLGNATLWPVLWACLHANHTGAWIALLSWICLRCVLARQRKLKLAGSHSSLESTWLSPVQDLVQSALWLFAQFGNQVHWRGKNYKVLAGGRMVEIHPHTPRAHSGKTTASMSAASNSLSQTEPRDSRPAEPTLPSREKSEILEGSRR